LRGKGAEEDGLEDADFGDGFGELVEGLAVEVLARVVGMDLYLVDGDEIGERRGAGNLRFEI